MKVFKFGGASIKNASSIRDVAVLLNNYKDEKIAIVLSAMGKNTNKLEELTKAVYSNNPDASEIFRSFKDYHLKIINDLYPGMSSLPDKLTNLFDRLEEIILSGRNKSDSAGVSFNKLYDAIVPFGEFVSTMILHEYLNKNQIPIQWVDAAKLIITDDTFKEGNVIWDKTVTSIYSVTKELFEKSNFIITQGFIGATVNGEYTTLGREGSDYTASILANILDAEECVFWKDVPGVMNADPDSNLNTILIDKLSYKEAIELTYYGAKVIHPKTIKPLKNKNIPLFVKSFKNPDGAGTIISNFKHLDFIPMYIFKQDQILISISARDLSFITESSLHNIFGLISDHGVKINLMQSSAISFSICVDNSEKSDILISDLQKDFLVKYNENLEIITIRHYNEEAIEKVLKDKMVIMEQRSRSTLQMVVDNN